MKSPLEPTALHYTAHLWCSHSKGMMNKIKVAYNDTLKILLKYPRWESASKMFAMFPLSNYCLGMLCLHLDAGLLSLGRALLGL